MTTEWLAAHLGDRDLRVYDCTTYLKPDPVTASGRRAVARSGPGHIPGFDYLDLQGELSDTSSKLRFTMPSAEQFAAAMSRHGLGDGTRAVLYSAGNIMWATRIWWMLRAFGFDAVAVLDGGGEVGGRRAARLHRAGQVPAGALRGQAAGRADRHARGSAGEDRGSGRLHHQRAVRRAAHRREARQRPPAASRAA